MVIDEETWSPNQEKRTTFEWEALPDGVRVAHEDSSYTVPWEVFSDVLAQARDMAAENDGQVVAGVNMDNPSAGSLGAWVVTQGFGIDSGVLTPRHLSFLGPIYGRMNIVDRGARGNAILWNIS